MMPELEGGDHAAACHLQDSLPAATPPAERDAGGERLRRLQAFFTGSTSPTQGERR
jgi:hypothetical protein